jgi:hypothetical protein
VSASSGPTSCEYTIGVELQLRGTMIKLLESVDTFPGCIASFLLRSLLYASGILVTVQKLLLRSKRCQIPALPYVGHCAGILLPAGFFVLVFGLVS